MKEPSRSLSHLRLLLPLLTRSLDGPALPNAAALEESRSPLGVVLWQMLQDTTLWSTADQRKREGLFADEAQPGAGLAPDVEEELQALAVLVRDPHPDAGPIIARLCDRVRLWTEQAGLLGTALAFAQVAALADPETAAYAYEVGRLARRRAEYARSELWYQRAEMLAKRHGDQRVRALSYSGLANLHSQRGNFAEARRLMERAARVATGRSHREILGAIYHGLAVLDFELGAVRDGMGYARRALRTLGPGHDQTPVVVQDMAVALMDHCGTFAAARQVLAAVIPHVRQREVRLLGLANLGRAAGATGERELFEAVWADCWPQLGNPADAGHNDALVAAGLVALARGAASLHDFMRARQAAERALTLSHGRSEGKSLYLAESLLCAIDADQRVQESVETAYTPDPALTTFAQDLLAACAHHALPPEDSESLRVILNHPRNARRAYQLGRALRAEGEYGRAAAWLERGIQLVERHSDQVCNTG